MTNIKKVHFNIFIPEHYRNLLRKMAAEKMMENPGKVVTGASIAAEILLSALDEIGKFKQEGENKK